METAKECARQIAAGGSAGLVEVCLMHPLDLIKTRLQIGGGHYAGLVDCCRKTFRSEGVRGFYKGILPPILAETPKRATKFFTFEQYKHAFAFEGLPVWVGLSLAGGASGLTEGILICPFEAVKVRLQAQTVETTSTMQMARIIAREHGIRKGLFRGLDATLGRHGVWNMLYFGIYHNIKDFAPSSADSPAANVSFRLFLGFVAGTAASVANIPFDVAKSRIQGPQPASGRIYHTCFQTMGLVAKQEGVAALYRGLLPKVMRLGPGGGIMLFVYESVYDLLKIYT